MSNQIQSPNFKIKLRNFLIYVFYYSGLAFSRPMILHLFERSLLRVLAYHEIKDQEKENFQKQLVFLRKKFHIISPDDFLKSNFSNDKTNILITFDDCYETWLSNVLPVLKEEKINAIFFLKGNNGRLARKILESGFAIGGHTKGHKRLPLLSFEETQDEIEKNKNDLEEIIGQKLIFFAYPFGDKKSFSPAVIEQVKAAGYQYGFTILPGFNTLETNQFLLHRDSVDPNWTTHFLKIWLSGSYDWKR